MSDAFRINVRDSRIAFLVSDDSTGVKYEPPIKIPGTMQIQLAPRVAEAILYGDGRERHKAVKVTGYDVTFDHNRIPPGVAARMSGKKYDETTGVRHSHVNDQPEPFAWGWVVDLTDNHEEITWLTKCTMSPPNRDMQQSEDSINYSTESMTVTALALDYNGYFEHVGDTSDEPSGFDKEKAAAFLESAPAFPPRSDSEQPGPDLPDGANGVITV